MTYGGVTLHQFRVPDAENRRRRLLEMTAEDRAAFERLDNEDEAFISEFYVQTITDYVTVAPRTPDTPSGQSLKLRYEGENGDVLTIETGAHLAEGVCRSGVDSRSDGQCREGREHPSAEEKTLAIAIRFERFLASAKPESKWGRPGATAAPVNKQDFVQRACTGGPRVDPVWRDRDVELHVCPVRFFTPDVEQVLEWFEATHRVELIGQVPQWQRVTLPYTGGLNEQPAKLIEALTFVCEQETRW